MRPPLPALQACPLDTMTWSCSRSWPACWGARSFLCPPPPPSPFLPAWPEASLRLTGLAQGHPFKG